MATKNVCEFLKRINKLLQMFPSVTKADAATGVP